MFKNNIKSLKNLKLQNISFFNLSSLKELKLVLIHY